MNDLFLRACRRQHVERLPVWMMRQAGRFLPEYRAIRKRVDFLTLCKTPELAAEVTLQPIDRLGLDAAIVFADILLPLEAMGAELRFAAGEGPVFDQPIRRLDDLDRLVCPDVEETLGYVFETLRTVRRALAGRVPLIGFAGTPWTLAAYLVEGGTSRAFGHLLGWSHRDPEGLRTLLHRLATTSLAYLRGQIAAGAQALQLFDTWGGLLDAERWRSIALPPLLEILDGLRGTVPLIYYGRGTAHLLAELRTLPVDVLSVDWRLPLAAVRDAVGPSFALQGNLDPTALLAPPERIEAAVASMVDAGQRAGLGNGHIINLGHGILPNTPVAHAQAFVEAAKAHGRRDVAVPG